MTTSMTTVHAGRMITAREEERKKGKKCVDEFLVDTL